jgi:hypothetical protein
MNLPDKNQLKKYHQFVKSEKLKDNEENAEEAKFAFKSYILHNPTLTKDNKFELFLCFLDLSIIARLEEDFFTSIEMSSSALELCKDDHKLTSLVLGNLGMVYKKLSLHIGNCSYREKAIEIFEKARELDKNVRENLINLSSMYVSLGEPHIAEDILINRLKPLHDEHHAWWNYSLVRLEQGDYDNGFSRMTHGFSCGKKVRRGYGSNRLPEWDGSPDKTVIVYGEQGIGDEILFSSAIPDLMKTNRVIFDCHPRLQKMFRESFPESHCFGTRKSNDAYWQIFDQADAHTDIVSLMHRYRKKSEDFPGTPFLIPDKELDKFYKEKLSNLSKKKKIGISWSGGTADTGKLFRQLPLENWIPLFDMKNQFEFISLQYQDTAQHDIEDLFEKYDVNIHHWQETVDDYDHTLALVNNLDAIISVPQSIIFLAGGVGTKCIQLTPIQSMWQCGVYGKDAPFFKSVKNIWQPHSTDFKDIIKGEKDNICKLLKTKI